ncbi:MAG TPA: calcium-binding protein [Actinomycetota bacterium]|nr:calcium-binding protein [Actinomycetota bacterium]
MNEDDLRRLLQSAGADPGPRDSWQTFLQVAHRRRRIQHAAVGAAVALAAVVAGVTWAAGAGITFGDDPKPADDRRDEERREDRTLEEREVERLERRFRETEETVDAVLPVRPPRRGRGTAAPPGPEDGGTTTTREPAPPDDDRTPRAKADPKDDLYGEMCWGQIPTIVGTNGRDDLRGTRGADVIVAGRGADTISGARGDDHVCAGGGDDVLAGGGGRDRLLGGAGDDTLAGGTGYDFAVYVDSASGVQVDLRAGSATGEGTDVLDGVEGAVGSAFADHLVGDVVGNLLGGGDGGDILEGKGGGDVLVPGPGDDVDVGGVGRDTISFQNGGWSPGERGVEIDLNTGTVVGEGDDELLGVESATGTFGNDVFSGNGAFNTFDGYAGDDRMTGAGADDYLVGGPGADTLDGGPGDDVLSGGGGVDTCTNGEQTDGCEAGTLDTLVLLGAAALVLERMSRSRRRSPQTAGSRQRRPSLRASSSADAGPHVPGA